MTRFTDSPPHHPPLSSDSVDYSLSIIIVEQVAAQKDVAPTALDPLYDTINPDALAALFDTRTNDASREQVKVAFEYSGCRVTVTGMDTVQVTPLDDQ
ncbi:HalOD1 output domain-containing protein [Haladaptatus sp. DFWS20]|uniref:HalOD1 output domain-containing protein n=1 Tax=Haladaptatus sp. DFWS20 TaxID=3403467 RepID=UPI003EBC10CF